MKRHSPHWGGVAKEANREDMGTTGRMLSRAQNVPPISIRAHLLERFGRERPIEINIRIPQALDHVDEVDAEEGIGSRQLEMLATRVGLQEAGVTFEALLGGWFAVRDNKKLRVAFERLADSQAKTSGFSFDDSLLHACNGLESLHAACFDGSVSEDAVTKEILTRLQDAVPDSHKDLLLHRLATPPGPPRIRHRLTIGWCWQLL